MPCSSLGVSDVLGAWDDSALRLPVALGKPLLPSPRRTQGKETGHLEDEPLLGERALETSVGMAEQVCPKKEGSPGRAGMVASVRVSSFRRAWQAFQCFPKSPCTRAGH